MTRAKGPGTATGVSSIPEIGVALEALRAPFHPGGQTAFLSDLTVGELILLEEIGYRPIEIVSGAGSANWCPQFTTAGTEAKMWGRAIASAIALPVFAKTSVIVEARFAKAASKVAMSIIE